jgi:hypothetical protein
MTILTQIPKQVNVEFWPLKDGAHLDPITDEWIIIFNGNDYGPYSTQAQAWQSYNDILRLDREHSERNPANVRSFFINGEPVTWESCFDCGMIIDEGESCPSCDIPWNGEPVQAGQSWGGAAEMYGLEARG